MSSERELLEQQRDQALTDLVDLERQVAEREIPDTTAEKLRRQYEVAAARAIEALETQPVDQPKATPQTSRRSRGRLAVYLLTTAAAVFAAVVLLPQYVAERPDGGSVTGNEVVQAASDSGSASPPPPPRDLSMVTEAEMEGVIAANPEVLGMRLALADRYLQKGRYDKAAEHYGVALKQDPGNPDVQAQSGWLLFKMGNPGAALRFVDQALMIAPGFQDALWYKANILLDGRKDIDAALRILRELATRSDLTADRRQQVDQLMAAARQAGGR